MARRDDVADLEEFGRFAEPALLILVSLADGAKHGYAITEDIASFAGVRFGPGSLYGAIARLESRGLIQALDAEDRHNPYELTAVGEKALRARLASMQAVERLYRNGAPEGVAVVALTREMSPATLMRAETLGVAGALRVPAEAEQLAAVLGPIMDGLPH